MRPRGTPAIVLFAVLLSLQTLTTPAAASPPCVAGQTCDYVILGNMLSAWVAPAYGDRIESDLSVTIEYHDQHAGHQTLDDLLQSLTESADIRDDIANAEVITIGVGFADMRTALLSWGAESPRPDEERMDEALEIFRETFGSILAEVAAVASPTAIIRTMDVYFPYVRPYKRRGIYAAVKHDWERFNEVIVATAQEHDVPVAKVYQAFNGPSGDDDPYEKGYMDRAEQLPNQKGREVIADLFRSLGYEPARR